MKFSIRAKLVAILFIASALPLLLGIVSVEFLGFRDFRRNKGQLYQASAMHYANGLAQLAGDQVQRLSDWTTLSNLSKDMANAPVITAARATYLEQNWNYFFPGTNSPELESVLGNKMALQLDAFQKRNPLFAEIFVTDKNGYLLASTNRTSDYIQSDEEWWSKAMTMPEGKAWVEGVAYDDSAAVHALKICLPVRSEKRIVGVLKASLNVSALFSRVPVVLREQGLRHDVILHDGRILVRLTDKDYPPLSKRVSALTVQSVKGEARPNGEFEKYDGWMMAAVDMSADKVNEEAKDKATLRDAKTNADLLAQSEKHHNDALGHEDLVGYANLRLQLDNVNRMALENLTPMSVLVYNDTDHVFAPVYKQLKMQSIAGLLLIIVFMVAGLSIAQQKLMTPLRLLRGAAKGLASTAQLDEEVAARATQEKARQLVAQLQQINTRDEIEELASDFAIMSQRVLSYHEQLESELSAKTGEIQRDLKIAREFQESLLPRHYPQVPEDGLQGALSLSFHHVYQPATSVCGDFFDVFKVSEGRAGVFIADVMGHGARSALVTAILRTLLQDLAGRDDDPAHILEQVNRHFSGILRGTGQFVFASAFCMVIDTVGHRVDFASAGHPAPLALDRQKNRVAPLLPEDFMDATHANAALGLDGESTYTRHSRELHTGDAFLLFTDGVSEAPAPDKEEFGIEKLCNSVRRQITHPIARICRAVCEDVNDWMDGVPSPDDICIVGVEIGPPKPSSAPNHSELENTKQ